MKNFFGVFEEIDKNNQKVSKLKLLTTQVTKIRKLRNVKFA